MQQTNLEILETICARICHDMVNPLSAINNTIELLNESPDEGEPEIIDIIGNNARSVQLRLQIARTAFGSGQNLTSSSGIETSKKLLDQYLEPQGISVIWNPDPALEAVSAETSAAKIFQIVLNLALVGTETLISGGTLTITSSNPAPSHSVWEITAQGPKCRHFEALERALLQHDTPEPRWAHALMAQQLGQKWNATIGLDPPDHDGNSVTMRLTVPTG